MSEDFAPNPQTDYGKSKLLAEEYIKSIDLPREKSFYILRPCMIHGPGNKGNLNLLYKFVLNGLPYPLAAFENQRSYISIQNLCFIIKEIVERYDVPSGIYNVSDNDPLSTKAVISLISKTINKKTSLISIPKSLVKVLATLGDILKLPFNTERLNKLTNDYVVSNKKIMSILNKELPISSAQGIQQTIESFATAHQP